MTTLSTRTAVLLAAGVVVLSTAGGATAATMITGANIKDGTVTSADVKNGSLASGDLASAVQKKYSVIQGYEAIRKSVVLPSGATGSVVASCSSGKHVIGGGAYFEESNLAAQFVPSDNTAGATAYGLNSTGGNLTLRVKVICATVAGNTTVQDPVRPATGSRGK